MKIFVLSDSPYLYTGLARVNRRLIRALSQAGNEVIVGGWGWDQLAYPLNEDSQWIYEDSTTGSNHVAFPMPKNPEKQLVYLYEVMKRIGCDAIFTMGDYWNFDGFHLLKQKLDYSFKWFAYYTIESEPINEKYKSVFQHIDVLFSPSIYGKRVVRDSTGVEAVYAPYGVDHDKFYIMNDDEIAFQRNKRGLDGKFRFINVSKNQHRKNLPAFLEALKLAHDENEAIVGYMHTNAEKKNAAQVHLENLIKRFGLEDVVEFPEKKISIDWGCSDDILNVEYNCSDAFALTTVAEGFGLPLLEAQACGLPVVATDCSTIPELVAEKDFLVKGQKYYTSLEHEVKIVNVEDLAETMLKMSKLTYDKQQYSEFSKGFFWDRMNRIIAETLSSCSDKVRIAADSI